MSVQVQSVAPVGIHEPTSYGDHHHGQGEHHDQTPAPGESALQTYERLQQWQIPPSRWIPLIHPCVEEVSQEVDGYFLEHWPFPDAASRKTFLKAGFSRVTCLYFPLSKDDRIHFACRLLTVLFLIDGEFRALRLPPSSLLTLDRCSGGNVIRRRRSLQQQADSDLEGGCVARP